MERKTIVYAQKNYPEKITEDNDATISESGALLVAFSNLLDRLGHNLDPKQLIQFLVNDGIDPHTGLTWMIPSIIDPTIGTWKIGDGAPTNSNSIVKLIYPNKITDAEAVTYALVASVKEGTIVDSYDGEIRSWDIYGGPRGFASYELFEQLEVTSLTPATPVVQPAEPTDQYELVVDLPGYGSSADAAVNDDSRAVSTALPGKYFVFNEMNGMLNLTKNKGSVGYWINPTFNGLADVEEDTRVPVRVIPPDPNKWQKTYNPNVGTIEYVAINDTIVKDLAGELPEVELKRGTIVPVAGGFSKDGTYYFRTATSADTGHWYGIPRTNLLHLDQDVDIALDHMLNSSDEELNTELGRREKAIKTGATIEGKFAKIKKLISFRKK